MTAPRPDIPTQMQREIIRRLFLVGGLFLAVVLFTYAPTRILRLSAIDFVEEHQRWHAPSRGFGVMEAAREVIRRQRGDIPLEQFVREKTKDRVITVDTPDWAQYFDRLSAPTYAPSTSRPANLPPRHYHFIPASLPPAQALASQFDHDPFRYLLLQSPSGIRCLGATLLAPREASQSGADSTLVYPRRRWAPWVALAGLAAYVLMPRMKRIPDALAFGRISGVVLPDIMGLILAGLFFTLPFLIVPSIDDCTSAEMFSADRFWFFLIFWPFCLAGLTILWFASLYASLQIVLEPEGLLWVTPARSEAIPFDQIESVRPVDQRSPRWLVVLGFILIFFTWRAIVPSRTVARYHRIGIDIFRRDGRRFRVWSDMPGFNRLARAMKLRNIPLPPNIR